MRAVQICCEISKYDQDCRWQFDYFETEYTNKQQNQVKAVSSNCIVNTVQLGGLLQLVCII